MHNYANHQMSLVRQEHARATVRNRFGVQYAEEVPGSELVVAHGRFVIRRNGSIEEAILGPRLMGRRHSLTIRPLTRVGDRQVGQERVEDTHRP